MIASGPSRPTAAATAPSTSAQRLTSPETKNARPPLASIAWTVSFPPSGRRSKTATGAPAAPSATAIARPIPEPPPVTRAAPGTRLIVRRTPRPPRGLGGGIAEEHGGQVLAREDEEVLRRRIVAPEAEGRHEDQAPDALGEDRGQLGGDHPTEEVADQGHGPDAEGVQQLLVGQREVEHVLQRLEARSEEHTSELQSQFHLVCRLLLEKKKQTEKTTL